MDNLAILACFAILSLLHFKIVLNNSSSALVTWSQTRTSFLHNLHLKVCITLLSRKNHKFRPQLSPCLSRNRCRAKGQHRDRRNSQQKGQARKLFLLDCCMLRTYKGEVIPGCNTLKAHPSIGSIAHTAMRQFQ